MVVDPLLNRVDNQLGGPQVFIMHHPRVVSAVADPRPPVAATDWCARRGYSCFRQACVPRCRQWSEPASKRWFRDYAERRGGGMMPTITSVPTVGWLRRVGCNREPWSCFALGTGYRRECETPDAARGLTANGARAQESEWNDVCAYNRNGKQPRGDGLTTQREVVRMTAESAQTVVESTYIQQMCAAVSVSAP